ncbi:MAG TPA: hypothetical protein VM118_13090 [Acidobacteriota bacterium]|nr:hypothetical protein [Acidobacteriota bacterium]
MTIRRAVIVGTVLLFALAGSAVAGKKQKTGTIEDNFYRDNLYGFTFEGFDNWKFSGIKKEDPEKPKPERFTLVQKNYQIPAERRENQEDYTPPTLGLWVDTCTLSIDSFAVEIANPKSKLKARKSLTEAFPTLRRASFVEQGRIQIDDADGVIQQYRVQYEAQLYDRVSDHYSVIEEILLGDLYIVKRGDRIFAFFFRAERHNYRQVKEEVTKMILSVDFDPAPPETEETGG